MAKPLVYDKYSTASLATLCSISLEDVPGLRHSSRPHKPPKRYQASVKYLCGELSWRERVSYLVGLMNEKPHLESEILHSIIKYLLV